MSTCSRKVGSIGWCTREPDHDGPCAVDVSGDAVRVPSPGELLVVREDEGVGFSLVLGGILFRSGTLAVLYRDEPTDLAENIVRDIRAFSGVRESPST